MERLTNANEWSDKIDLTKELGYSHLWKRLKEYEDLIGIDHLRELIEAEKDSTKSDYSQNFDKRICNLADYEDTGLEPEEINAAISIKAWDEAVENGYHEAIMELKEYYDLGDIAHIRDLIAAEKDGRLVVLPCKVGDTVYVDKRILVDAWRIKGISADFAIGKVVAFSKDKQSAFVKIEFSYEEGGKVFRDRYLISAIGITVFLTLEEAEAALTVVAADR